MLTIFTVEMLFMPGTFGVITPNKIPLEHIFKKVTEAEFQTIGPLYLHAVWYLPFTKSKETYCHHFSDLQWQPSDPHKMSVAIFTTTPDINKWQMSLV